MFSSLSANEYLVISVNEGFTQPGGIDYRDLTAPTTPSGNGWEKDMVDELHVKAVSGRLDRLDNTECITAYTQAFQSSRSNLVAVLDDHINQTVYWGYARGAPFPLYGDVVSVDYGFYNFDAACGISQSFTWVCGPRPGCTTCEELVPGIKANASGWTMLGNRVKYCLSESAADQCNLYLHPTVAIVVNSINLAKVIAILLVFHVIREPPLATLGDAVASFMERPDPATAGLGVVSRRDFARGWPSGPKPYDASTNRWAVAAGVPRVVFAVLL